MRDIEKDLGLREAIRQFERYQESGWSKSEVPNSACLIRALDALRDNNQLRAENQRLKEALEKLLNEGDIGIHCFDNGDGAYIGNAVHPESEAVLEAEKALEVSADD